MSFTPSLEETLKRLEAAFWPKAIVSSPSLSSCKDAYEDCESGSDSSSQSSVSCSSLSTVSESPQHSALLHATSEREKEKKNALSLIKRSDPRPWRSVPESFSRREREQRRQKGNASTTKAIHTRCRGKVVQKAPIVVQGAAQKGMVNMIRAESRFHEKAKDVLGVKQYVSICRHIRPRPQGNEEENNAEGQGQENSMVSELKEFLDQVESTMEPSKRTGAMTALEQEIESVKDETVDSLRKKLREEVEEDFKSSSAKKWQDNASSQWKALESITGTKLSAKRYWKGETYLVHKPRATANRQRTRPQTARTFKASYMESERSIGSTTPVRQRPTSAHPGFSNQSLSCKKRQLRETIRPMSARPCSGKPKREMTSVKRTETGLKQTQRRPQTACPSLRGASSEQMSKPSLGKPQERDRRVAHELADEEEEEEEKNGDGQGDGQSRKIEREKEDDKEIQYMLEVKESSQKTYVPVDTVTKELFSGIDSKVVEDCLNRGDFKSVFTMWSSSAVSGNTSTPSFSSRPVPKKPDGGSGPTLRENDLLTQLRQLRKEYENATFTRVRNRS